ncbi:STM3941 family protein [Undibacterium sp. TS12]|uniref:STM3941 family protein n=1 Tax=Undibacterium sp. TS12 TaxID=2908202 RepID=UPI001F4C904C|nr:STM3941 family protein [Undibacterium sp. TS12]MCH8622344.1 hypothetical protein [Undibacterium sp. TS12]
MSGPDETVIELSKSKLRGVVAGALVFVAASIWMVQMDAAQVAEKGLVNDVVIMHGIGWAGLVFFGLCGFAGLLKIIDRKPGLVLSQAGIHDNSSYLAAGLIPWSDITGLSVFEVSGQRVMVVNVRDPERYISLGSLPKRALKRINHRLCGSPVGIASNSLKLGFEELLDTTGRYLQKYGGRY